MAARQTKRATSRKPDRMNFRLDPEIKERVARAAAITGQGLTDFAVSTLSEKADEIIARHDTLLLDRDEFKFFLEVLDHARAPSKRSLAAAKRYRRGRREGARHRV
ncbi:MAG TPA: DUF1778 domain-containing protein [Blastocatellia bacterium]|nr:DUF1778 domain-containing protein [Blastocatellia bacterium]